MTTREQIYAEIEQLDPVHLDELHSLVQQLLDKQTVTPSLSIFEKLQRIQIEGPEDLSTNFERYMGGDTDDESDIR